MNLQKHYSNSKRGKDSKKTPVLKAIPTSEYPALAKRPLNSSLSSEKCAHSLVLNPQIGKKGVKSYKKF